MSEHVLVVDDEPIIRRFAARGLREEGFGVSPISTSCSPTS